MIESIYLFNNSLMHAITSYISYSNGYPASLSYPHNHHLINASVDTNNATHLRSFNECNSDLNLTLSSDDYFEQSPSDNNDNPQSVSSPAGSIVNTTLVPTTNKRSRIIPPEEKDNRYYDKRARNNEAAKRSRDSRRIKERQIQEHVTFLEHENLRLSMENQAIRYQLSQLHALYNRTTK